MHYRLYCPEDFPQLYAIELACFQPPIRFSRRYMLHLVTTPDSVTWVAEESNQMAGFAIALWTQESGQTLAYLQTIEVAPAYRQRGVASELLHRVEASSLTSAACLLWLHVAEDNASAIRLYQAHGYHPEGREENYYGPNLHAKIFSKSLS